MTTLPLYPFLLDPALHVIVWGGRKLATHLNKPLPTDQPYGEAWELDNTAIVATGALAGRTLGELVAEYGEDLIGAGNDPADGMPLLIKILDANQWLSVQVHPNDEFCRQLENSPRGKTEAWVVIDAEPGAQLINGLQPGTTRPALADAIAQNSVRDLLLTVDVQTGDSLYMPAGIVHALGPGLLIYEVQQACNITYRLYDWGRVGLDGKPRALHIDKGVGVTNPDLSPIVGRTGDHDTSVVFDNDYFCTIYHRLTGGRAEILATDGRFQAITCLSGWLTVTTDAGALTIPMGRTGFIPAMLSTFTLSGDGVGLRSFQPAV